MPDFSAGAAFRDRARGALLGLAAGDALGTTVEFRTRGSFPPVTDMTGGGPFHLQPGQWTDDTSMALCLAASLVETGRFDPPDQMRRYLRWYRSGFVVHTLEAALWCFHHARDFRQGCLMAANLGDDADTVAAVYGQIAGAHWGESGIPPEWLSRLAWAAQIRDLADRLLLRRITDECGSSS